MCSLVAPYPSSSYLFSRQNNYTEPRSKIPVVAIIVDSPKELRQLSVHDPTHVARNYAEQIMAGPWNARQLALCQALGIRHPIIQAGMVWTSGSRLAAAASEAGCLGVIGAGSMDADLLRAHLVKARQLTASPLAVNIPLLHPKSRPAMELCLEEGIRIFITSAGNPRTHTQWLRDNGARVVMHVVASPVTARKAEDAGCDAIIAEGFEAGGHNGREELTTLVLTPLVCDAVRVPVIAAGGIADSRGMRAVSALGAAGFQLGTRFLATLESSAHPAFKSAVINSTPDSTVLCMKSLMPVRLMKNKFYEDVKRLECGGVSVETLAALLGKGRARRGIFEGDLDEGELEIGQACALVREIPSVSELVQRLVAEYAAAAQLL